MRVMVASVAVVVVAAAAAAVAAVVLLLPLRVRYADDVAVLTTGRGRQVEDRPSPAEAHGPIALRESSSRSL